MQSILQYKERIDQVSRADDTPQIKDKITNSENVSTLDAPVYLNEMYPYAYAYIEMSRQSVNHQRVTVKEMERERHDENAPL